ncbi:acyl carrier protein [Bacteroides graminisolvens]|uniref:acyl carrier protein n=1 Tax=Bacteroides graminisolvens TaxID=477666 RepID=UPI0003FC7274|nr:hypothetical protein [Bacteroides graminisolvens]
MKKQELNVKVKEIIIETLNLNMEVKDILDETPLFGTSYKPGLFDNSLCVLEVTSALVGEFDIEPSCFDNKSFETVGSLADSVYNAVENKDKE